MGGEAKDLYNMAIAFLLNNMVCRALKPMRRIRLTLRKRTMIRHLPILIGKVREVLLLLLGKMVQDNFERNLERISTQKWNC